MNDIFVYCMSIYIHISLWFMFTYKYSSFKYLMYIHWYTVFWRGQHATSTAVHHSEAGDYRLQGHAGF